MSDLRLSPCALRDLKEIKQYIEKELDNPEAAITTIKRIIESYDKLKDYPLLGPSLAEKINIATDYRYLISGN